MVHDVKHGSGMAALQHSTKHLFAGATSVVLLLQL